MGHRAYVWSSLASFTRLVEALSTTSKSRSPIAIFSAYLQSLPSNLPTSFGIHLFRLLFPHLTPRRRYNMRERTLAKAISDAMGWEGKWREAVMEWDQPGQGGIGKKGCLGDEVKQVAELRVCTCVVA